MIFIKLLKKLFSTKKKTKSETSKVKHTPPSKLNLETEQGILSITKKDYFRLYNGQDLYYALQRKATQHKKNGNMDAAIACLRKSNEISDAYERPPLSESDYLRLVKYLQKAGYDDVASIEEQNIYSKHPEFKDKSIITKRLFDEACKNALGVGSYLIIVNASEHCELCKRYNNKVYSISGKHLKYHSVPKELKQGGPCKNHVISFYTFFPNITKLRQ